MLSMPDIVVRSSNPYDLSAGELEDLAEALRSSGEGLDVEVQTLPERGYGVTPYEVVEIVSTVGGAAGAVQVVASAVAWAQRRWKSQKAEHPERAPRPKVLKYIHGADGQVLLSVTIDGATGEATEDGGDT